MLSAAENVGAPLRLARVAPAERERRVELLLELVGLADHAEQRPGELSGGQQQRVAIARALAASPRLLIADEPTGQLDAETGLSVMALLRGVVESEGVTALVSTHDPVMMALADRVIRIHDGQLRRRRARASSPAAGRVATVLRLLARRARAQWPLLAALLAVVTVGATLLGTCALLVTRTAEQALEVAASRAAPDRRRRHRLHRHHRAAETRGPSPPTPAPC